MLKAIAYNQPAANLQGTLLRLRKEELYSLPSLNEEATDAPCLDQNRTFYVLI
jgi:hypothetical protein